MVIAASCASAPGLASAPDPSALPSPTPFQPEGGASPAPDPGFDAQNIATFTPYPTVVLKNGIYLTPQVTVSGAAASAAIDPLTGLPGADPNGLQRRPLAIKVANFPRYVRPQYGLTEADLAFEYYSQQLETRFIAVFYGNTPNMVGPVRSGRYFDEHVVRMYHAFFVFQYADPRELTYFMSGDLNPFLVLQGFGKCPPFFNPKIHETYNDAYFDVTKWNDCAQQLGRDNSPQTLRSSFFGETPPANAPLADRIFTNFTVESYNYWQYDPLSGTYLRYQDVNDARDEPSRQYAPLVDGLTARQVSADNVIVLFVPYNFANENEQEDEAYHVDLIDSGNAFVFRNGRAVPAHWFRTDIDQPLLVTNLDGSPVYLKPGQTFFEVIGETSTLAQDGADWHFGFQTP